jgi:hypothetical protein
VVEQVTIHDLTGTNSRRLEDLLTLYTELFPQYRHYIPHFRYIASQPFDADPEIYTHVWLICVDDQPAALMDFEYVLDRNIGLLMDIAVKPEYRRISVDGYDRLSEWMIHKCLRQLETDAQLADRPAPIGLAAEVDAPQIVVKYRTYGFVDNPAIEYYEPPSIANMDDIIPPQSWKDIDFRQMTLGIFPTDARQFDPSDPDVWAEVVKAYSLDHYRLDSCHDVVQSALESIYDQHLIRGY